MKEVKTRGNGVKVSYRVCFCAPNDRAAGLTPKCAQASVHTLTNTHRAQADVRNERAGFFKLKLASPSYT